MEEAGSTTSQSPTRSKQEHHTGSGWFDYLTERIAAVDIALHNVWFLRKPKQNALQECLQSCNIIGSFGGYQFYKRKVKLHFNETRNKPYKNILGYNTNILNTQYY